MAGIYAILASVFPNATAAQLEYHFKKYAADLGDTGWDKYYGWGWVQIDKLLDNAPGDAPDEPDPDPEPEPEPDPETWTADVDFVFGITFKAQDAQGYSFGNVQYEYEFTGTGGFDVEFDRHREYLQKYHSGRFLILLPGADLTDAAIYTAYFLEVIGGRDGYKYKVKRIRIDDGKRSAVVTDPASHRAVAKVIGATDFEVILDNGVRTYKE